MGGEEKGVPISLATLGAPVKEAKAEEKGAVFAPLGSCRRGHNSTSGVAPLDHMTKEDQLVGTELGPPDLSTSAICVLEESAEGGSSCDPFGAEVLANPLGALAGSSFESDGNG